MSNKNICLKCVSDSDMYIIPVEDIISMTPIISRDNDPYIQITYKDSEMCITNTIYCTKAENDSDFIYMH